MIGFGCIGMMFVFNQLKEQFDIMVMLKGFIGGIFFFLIISCSVKIFDVFWLDDKMKVFFYGYLYMVNFVGCVVVLVSFDLME